MLKEKSASGISAVGRPKPAATAQGTLRRQMPQAFHLAMAFPFRVIEEGPISLPRPRQLPCLRCQALIPAGDVSIDGTDVAFRGSDDFLQSNSAIYFWSGGALTTIADYNTPIPEASGRFDLFSATAVSEGNVLFLARSGEVWGLYVWSQGKLIKVIREGETLGGQRVHGMSITPESMSGSRIVFRVFIQNRFAVYVADLASGSVVEVPTLGPAMLAFLVLGLAAAALVQLRRKGSFS